MAPNPKLAVDGIIGPKTLATAAKLHVAVPQELAPKPAPAAPTSPSTPTLHPQSTPAPTTETADTVAPAPRPNLGSVDDQIHATFGYLAWAWDNPEIRPHLREGDQRGLDRPQHAHPHPVGQGLFTAELVKTHIWQATDANQRQWMELKATDNATAQGQVDSRAKAIIAQAAPMGIAIDPGRAKAMAEDSLKNGWDLNSAELRSAIAAEFHYQPGAQSGTLGQAETTLKQLAQQYLVPLSDDTLADWERKLADGTAASPEVFHQYMVDAAKRRFPTLSKQLDSGATVEQLAEPYKQSAAKLLGVNPDSIDLNDAKWRVPLVSYDPKLQDFTMMSDYQWEKTLRSDPVYGWGNSKNGIDSATSFPRHPAPLHRKDSRMSDIAPWDLAIGVANGDISLDPTTGAVLPGTGVPLPPTVVAGTGTNSSSVEAILLAALRDAGIDGPEALQYAHSFLINHGSVTEAAAQAQLHLDLYDPTTPIGSVVNQRYPEIAQLRAHGNQFSIANAIDFHVGAKNLMREKGFPPGFYDSDAEISQLAAQGLSLNEINDRADAGFSRVVNSDPTIRDAFAQYFGPSGDAALAAYFLDPTKAIPVPAEARRHSRPRWRRHTVRVPSRRRHSDRTGRPWRHPRQGAYRVRQHPAPSTRVR
jgi:hypothetical protein